MDLPSSSAVQHRRFNESFSQRRQLLSMYAQALLDIEDPSESENSHSRYNSIQTPHELRARKEAQNTLWNSTVLPWEYLTPTTSAISLITPQTAPPSTPLSSSPTFQSTFALFPLFPYDIRLLIWKAVANTPRIIRLDYKRHTGIFQSHQAPPPLLHVSRESRTIGQQSYDRAFGDANVFVNFSIDTIFVDNGMQASADPRLRRGIVVRRQDTRSEPSTLEPTACLLRLLRNLSPVWVGKIRYLAVGCTLAGFKGSLRAEVEGARWGFIGAYSLLGQFRGLEKLVFAVGEGGRYEEVNRRTKELGRGGLSIVLEAKELAEKEEEYMKSYVESLRVYLEVEKVEKGKFEEKGVPELAVANLTLVEMRYH